VKDVVDFLFFSWYGGLILGVVVGQIPCVFLYRFLAKEFRK
jgi:sulfite exporter TauE/SafE